ncbi:MAG: hypothetical protein LH606_09840 [Cytophagaceae bacterium]|nr:hypothetical protein [Cytophagaceae bacterium]
MLHQLFINPVLSVALPVGTNPKIVPANRLEAQVFIKRDYAQILFHVGPGATPGVAFMQSANPISGMTSAVES